ncbi:ADP-forming succinate--CoA ligase subunit beta [candidate division KSB1 bacterium]|nr:MAG: ADP-forming succinate--CoA ligase subunit beta [candidate division KSB1 bacterium]HDI51278.1 ADP-forming succinate--CoA ligase subunit beta [Bacteroidota bacterium]
MKIHEYQAKEILKQYGVAVPKGRVAFTPTEAKEIAAELACSVVVKAQIHAGGRGKAGGIKIAKSPEEAEKAAAELIGKCLVTYQTGPGGRTVRKVLVEETMEIEEELYAGIVLDRSCSQLVFMVSTEGGVEIEKVAAESPEKILKERIDPCVGLLPFQARRMIYGLGLKGDQFKSGAKFLSGLYKAYVSTDASLAEINPLVVTRDGRVLALDAKLNFDDNALYRHPDIAKLRDINEEDPLEVEASKYNLNYIRLEGNVGCMVNGAGLAMSTMDIIKLAGGEPANFLDVGGGASAETVANGFRILLSDKNVKAVLINIFGGIVRCDRVAAGVVEAAKKVNINVPVVVRLQGTNAEEAAEILNKSGLSFAVAKDLKEAAEKVVATVK